MLRSSPARLLAFLAYLPLIGLATPAQAHDLWLETEPEALVLYQGHRHASHAGADIIPYSLGIFQAAHCAPGAGSLNTIHKQYPLRFEGNCALLQVSLSSGYWTKTPWETHNAPKTGISGALKSWRAEEQLSRLDRWGVYASHPTGANLEIIPSHDPFALQVGDKLTVRVFAAGQPVAGVPVAYGEKPRGTTGPDGSIAIRLRQGGLQLISASRETPLNDGKADLLVQTATLQFTLRP